MLLSGKGQLMVLEWMTHKEHYNLFCVRKIKTHLECNMQSGRQSIHWLRAWDFETEIFESLPQHLLTVWL